MYIMQRQPGCNPEVVSRPVRHTRRVWASVNDTYLG